MEIIKKIIKKVLGPYYIRFIRKLDEIKIQIAKNFFFNLESKLDQISNINSLDYKVFSQNGEDGIIQYFVKSLKLSKIKFVEIGTEDYSESNTRYLYETIKADGLIIDPYKNLKNQIQKHISLLKNNLTIHNDYASSKNINEILKKYNFDNNLDIFSIDIDGVDYWVINELPGDISKIFIAEYNPFFGPDIEVTVPDDNNFNRTKYHYSNLCFGMSIRSLINLMIKKNYTFYGTNDVNQNAFFISNKYIDKIKLTPPKIDDLNMFTDCNIKESKDREGNFNLLNKKEILKEIENCEVFDLKQGKINLIKNIIE